MMNLEVLQSRLAFQSLSEDTLKESLVSRSLDWAADYVSGSLQGIELATADLYVQIIASPNFSEGSLSITYDRAELKSLAIAIYTKYGDAKLNDLTITDSIKAVDLW